LVAAVNSVALHSPFPSFCLRSLRVPRFATLSQLPSATTTHSVESDRSFENNLSENHKQRTFGTAGRRVGVDSLLWRAAVATVGSVVPGDANRSLDSSLRAHQRFKAH